MGTLSDFFAGTLDDAVKLKRRKGVSANGIHGLDVLRLWAMIERRPVDNLEGSALENIKPPGVDKPLELWRLPPQLVNALASVKTEGWVNELAQKWAASLGAVPAPEPGHLVPLVEQLAELARGAQKKKRDLFLWVSA